MLNYYYYYIIIILFIFLGGGAGWTAVLIAEFRRKPIMVRVITCLLLCTPQCNITAFLLSAELQVTSDVQEDGVIARHTWDLSGL